MPLADNYEPIKYVADGVTVEFTFNWNYVSADSVKVYSEVDGVQTLIESGYTLTPATNGGVITFDEAPADMNIIISRETPNTQSTIYVTSKGFEAKVIQDDLDRRTAVSQESRELSNRTLAYPLGTSSSIGAEIPAPTAGKSLKGSSDGLRYIATTYDPDDAGTYATQAQASASAASTSATNALASKEKAEKWAEEAEDVEVETGKYSAKHWSAKAEEFAGSVDSTKLVPIGTVLEYSGSTAPDGFLIADGSAISRTAYADLFAIDGTVFGAGNGSTTFNIPDRRERVGVGYKSGSAEFGTLGQTGGKKTHTLTVDEMPNHAHPVVYSNETGTAYTRLVVEGSNSSGSLGDTAAAVGGGQAHNNLQPYITMNYIIKY